VELFNSKPQNRLHFTDKEVLAITEEDIRFPIKYQKAKSALEQTIETTRMKTRLANLEDIEDKYL